MFTKGIKWFSTFLLNKFHVWVQPDRSPLKRAGEVVWGVYFHHAEAWCFFHAFLATVVGLVT
jgi:hypothetical protein